MLVNKKFELVASVLPEVYSLDLSAVKELKHLKPATTINLLNGWIKDMTDNNIEVANCNIDFITNEVSSIKFRVIEGEDTEKEFTLFQGQTSICAYNQVYSFKYTDCMLYITKLVTDVYIKEL